jgi:hypothetical protein
MIRNHSFLRQTGLVARLGLLEMPTQAKTFVAPTARLWYKPAVARGLSGSRGLQNVRYGYGPRMPRPSGAGVIGHRATNRKGR